MVTFDRIEVGSREGVDLVQIMFSNTRNIYFYMHGHNHKHQLCQGLVNAIDTIKEDRYCREEKPEEEASTSGACINGRGAPPMDTPYSSITATNTDNIYTLTVEFSDIKVSADFIKGLTADELVVVMEDFVNRIYAATSDGVDI